MNFNVFSLCNQMNSDFFHENHIDVFHSCFLLLTQTGLTQLLELCHVFGSLVIPVCLRLLFIWMFPNAQISKAAPLFLNTNRMSRSFCSSGHDSLYGQDYWNIRWSVLKSLFVESFSYPATVLWGIGLVFSIFFSPRFETALWIPLLMAFVSFAVIRLKICTEFSWVDLLKPMSLLSVNKAHVSFVVQVSFVITAVLGFLMKEDPENLEQVFSVVFFAFQFFSTALLGRGVFLIMWYGAQAVRTDLIIGVFLHWILPGILYVIFQKVLIPVCNKMLVSVVGAGPKPSETILNLIRRGRETGVYDFVLAGATLGGFVLTAANTYQNNILLEDYKEKIIVLEDQVKAAKEALADQKRLNDAYAARLDSLEAKQQAQNLQLKATVSKPISRIPEVFKDLFSSSKKA